jgi:hypothetical protein|tara:strand:+ start:255 stop:452 length:198 start_codon:yes stop_codon:yes gene_type:complete
MGDRPNMRNIAGENRKPEPTEMVKDVAYLQSPVIDKVKPKPTKPKESSSNTYAKDNQAAIKKLKA